MRLRTLIPGIVLWLTASASSAQPQLALPLSSSGGGAFEIAISHDAGSDGFLLDTGAAMMTINGRLYDQLRKSGSPRHVREVAVRMADGRHRKLDVYEVSGLRLGDFCDLGTVEVVVVPGKGRNLLGLNVLQRFAPLTLSMDPPALSVSGCGAPQPSVAAAAANTLRPEIAPHVSFLP